MSEIPHPCPSPEEYNAEAVEFYHLGMEMYQVSAILNGESFTFNYQGDKFWKYNDGSSKRIKLNPEEIEAAGRIVEQLTAGRRPSNCPSRSCADAPLADS